MIRERDINLNLEVFEQTTIGKIVVINRWSLNGKDDNIISIIVSYGYLSVCMTSYKTFKEYRPNWIDYYGCVEITSDMGVFKDLYIQRNQINPRDGELYWNSKRYSKFIKLRCWVWNFCYRYKIESIIPFLKWCIGIYNKINPVSWKKWEDIVGNEELYNNNKC